MAQKLVGKTQKSDGLALLSMPIIYLLYISRFIFNNNLKYKVLTMNKQYKRQFRELSDETKGKISKSLSGRHLSDRHRKAIASSLKKYWSKVKSKYEIEKD